MEQGEQLALLRDEVRRRRPKPSVGPAPEHPVARVAVDLPLAHLDRPFDYVVPAPLHDDAVPGTRVKVRFAGRDVDGFLVERADDTDHVGALAALRKVVSPEPVLSPNVLAVARMVADRYAGTLADVLRLAVPPRHARVEAEDVDPIETRLDLPLDTLGPAWSASVGGEAYLRRLASAESPRGVWTAMPGHDWPGAMASAAAATAASGRGSLLLVPDARDVARLDAALTALLGPHRHVVLTADLGQAARYRAFLAASRGRVPIVVGTRAAAFAPVEKLGLVAMWDDGDDLYAEPRAPYPHAREVLLLRAHHEQTAVLLGGHARSVEGQALVESGWAAGIAADRGRVRSAAPAGARHRRVRARARTRHRRLGHPDATPRLRGRQGGAHDRTRPRAQPAVRLPTGARVHRLPPPGPLRALPRPARPLRRRRRPDLPLVRTRGRGMVVPALPRRTPPRAGRRFTAHGRGVGPQLPVGPGRHVRGRARARPAARLAARPRHRDRDARRRAARDGGVRRRCPPRHLAVAEPARVPRGRGVPATLAQHRRAGPPWRRWGSGGRGR